MKTVSDEVVRPGPTVTTPDFVHPRKTKPPRTAEVIETTTCHHVVNRDPQLDSTASPPRALSLAGELRVIVTRTTPVKLNAGNAYPQKNVKHEGVSAPPNTTEKQAATRSQPSRPGRPGCAATWPATATENWFASSESDQPETRRHVTAPPSFARIAHHASANARARPGSAFLSGESIRRALSRGCRSLRAGRWAVSWGQY